MKENEYEGEFMLYCRNYHHRRTHSK